MQLLRTAARDVDDSDEADLVRRAVAGDREAFADLYQAHLNRVFRYFHYRLGHREDAEDLTEQVFLRAWQAISRYDYRGLPFASWVFRIAHNELVDHRQARTRLEVRELSEELDFEDPDAGPEDQTALRFEAAELSSALHQLSDVEQSVIALRFVAGLDHRTVARIVGKTSGATRSIQMRALDRLEQILRARERRDD